MENNHVCPWWMGYFLLSPFRRYIQNPLYILRDYVIPGMHVMDYGSAMGYFSLPIAKMVRPSGRVYCFDIQKKMLDRLMKRARSADLDQWIESRLVTEDKAFEGLDQNIDFALLFAVVHEVHDQMELFSQICSVLKPGARILFTEPRGHVNAEHFNQSVGYARAAGLEKTEDLSISRSHAILLQKSF